MRRVLSQASAAAISAPIDFATSQRISDWRENVAWPLAYTESFALGRKILNNLQRSISDLPDETDRAVALLAAGRLAASILPVAELALAIERESATGIALIGDLPEAAYLRGLSGAGESQLVRRHAAFKPMAVPRALLARRLARVASWSSPLRAIPSLLWPQAVATSHNVLLRDAARKSPIRLGFMHAETFLLKARRKAGELPLNTRTDAIAAMFAQTLLTDVQIEGSTACRLRNLVLAQARFFMAEAAHDLRGMRWLRHVPAHIWSGSGGYWPSRCIALEVLRRGGRVTRFEHGGTAALLGAVEPIALIELSVSSEFVLGTPAAAENLRKSGALELTIGANPPELIAMQGNAELRELPLNKLDPTPSRRRALYGPTILRGMRQFFPPLLPDTIYLDWQFRLVELLQELPLDLMLRPHPEGLFRGKPHPLSAVAAVESEPYEALLDRADVLVFDYTQSTTFYEALCTDRPIVLIDTGNPTFNPNARAFLERRCRIIRPQFDDRNRLLIDKEELEEAICGGPDTADPSEFHTLYLGDE